MPLAFPIERLGWVLLHFVWQAAVLAMILAIALRSMKRSPSLLRYVSACTILVLMALAPIVTFLLLPTNRAFDDRPLLVPDAALDNLPAFVGKTLPSSVVAASRGHNEFIRGAQMWLADKMPPLVAIWCAGAALMLARQIGAWIYLRRLVRRSSLPLRDSWARLNRLVERVGLKRRVQLLETTLLHVPATVGWIRPIVLLPASMLTGLSTVEIEALVLHELAHIRRHDYLINVLQTVVETLLFYHPAVWWVSKRIRVERENCCDDIAAAANDDAASYATALATIETLRPDSPRFALGAAGASLLDRIKRLTLAREIAVRRRHGAAVACSLLVAALLLLIQTQVLASLILEHRVRTLDHMPTFGQAVYAIMDMPRENDALLPAIEKVFAPLGKKQFADASSPAVTQLVVIVNRGGDPDALLKRSEAAMSAASRFAYQNHPDWKYGTYPQRMQLIRDLWKLAQEAYPSDPDRARTYARAAILLGGQEIMELGNALVAMILREDAGRNLAQLTARQLDQFQWYLQDSRALALIAVGHALQFTQAYDSLANATPEQRREAIATMIDAIDRMHGLGPQRMTVQWEVANLAQRLAHNPAAKELGFDLRPYAKRWSSEINQPQFDEWMRQAIEEDPAKIGSGAMVKRMSMAEVNRRTRRAPSTTQSAHKNVEG
jgi:beta-lactamase regulating signal transducer with metallopeptidase domain